MTDKKYDHIIIGGGIFGIYTAIYLSQKNQKVCVIEKENVLFKKASIVNQARLHAGYHYPRSIATAKIADSYKERFTRDHAQFINFKFKKYYAIDKYGSFTNSTQFERFCNTLNIMAEPVKEHPLINLMRIEELYLTEEFSFDPVLIAEFYKHKIKEAKNVDIVMHAMIAEVIKETGRWKIKIYDITNKEDVRWIESQSVINATYCGTNTVNRLFGITNLKLMHEITEMAMISSSEFQNIGLTIMDGHFASLMPYGLSGLLSLSSVTYTHHKVSYDDEPVFDCQQLNNKCKPDAIEICNNCPAKPESNKNKMLCQIRNYINENVELTYLFSMFTIKTKLQASYIDDGRPTEISKLNANPDFYCLFAGKINSIYEIEKFLTNEL
jgi:hypothetical protein